MSSKYGFIPPHESNNKGGNHILLILIIIAFVFGLQYLLPQSTVDPKDDAAKPTAAQIKTLEAATKVSRSESLASSKRVIVRNSSVVGSISLKGLRFDDLMLEKYKEGTQESSPDVLLLSPANVDDSWLVDIGWSSADALTPNKDTVWTADSGELTPEKSVKFSTKIGNLIFTRDVSIDNDYMFTIKESIINQGDSSVNVLPWARVFREGSLNSNVIGAVHQGGIAVSSGRLNETSYGDIKDDKEIVVEGTSDWMGITSKYWLTAVIPEKNDNFVTRYRFLGDEKYQAQMEGKEVEVKPNTTYTQTSRMFAGAKNLEIIQSYADKYKIDKFERSIDLGWFFFLTKPFMLLLHFIAKVIGNYGLALLTLTILVKMVLFPLAYKSYKSMSRMKELQPKINEIKESYKDDQKKIGAATMELYKKEKINPAAGCLPLLLQIPIFFALYKVFLIDIDMRHAPFFGWINDMAMPDPTSVLNLFGLLPYAAPSFFMIGGWALLMGISMYLQQLMNPAPQDPIQAKMFKFMPVIFTFMMAGFPAGLLIYWTWNNVLTILQQYLVGKLSNKRQKHARKA